MARTTISALAQGALVVLCVASSMWAAEEAKGTPLESFKPDTYGFISHWLVLLDPIPLPELSPLPFRESSADKEFFPGMKDCTPKEGDTVKLDNKIVEDFWNTNPYSKKPVPDVVRTWMAIHGDVFRINFPPRHNSLYLAVTYITCAEDIPEAKLKTGSGDFSVWLLNGKEIIRAVKTGKATVIDENVSEPVTLKRGVNVLMAKNINCYGGDTGLCARFVDKTDKAVTAVNISLTPPPSAK